MPAAKWARIDRTGAASLGGAAVEAAPAAEGADNGLLELPLTAGTRIDHIEAALRYNRRLLASDTHCRHGRRQCRGGDSTGRNDYDHDGQSQAAAEGQDEVEDSSAAESEHVPEAAEAGVQLADDDVNENKTQDSAWGSLRGVMRFGCAASPTPAGNSQVDKRQPPSSPAHHETTLRARNIKCYVDIDRASGADALGISHLGDRRVRGVARTKILFVRTT